MLIFEPGAKSPELREYDRPPTLRELNDGVGGYLEVVPHFQSISYGGTVLNCVAFCNEYGKLDHLPINNTATHAWNLALKRQGLQLCDERGIPKEWLCGSIVVLFGDREFMSEL